MKILVTGHEGFIGRNVFEYLTKKGFDVVGYEYNKNHFPSVPLYDWIIHLGAISSTTERDVDRVMEQNFEFSKKLLDKCLEYNVHLQYASSASVYGTNTDFREDAPKQPQSPYAWSKYLFDRYVNSKGYSTIVQGLRYFNVYGPYEEHKGDQSSPIHKFTKQAKQGSIKLFENSHLYRRDFVCVKDICEVHYKLLFNNASDIFNVGTGKPESFQTVAELIANKYNAGIEYIPMPEALKGQYQEYTCADIDRLTNTIDINFRTVEEYINEC